MTVTATEIDLTQWNDDELRDDVKRCMAALGMLAKGSPAHASLAQVITNSVAELLRRSPAGPDEARATICQCGEVFILSDDSTLHFVKVFVPQNNVGADGQIHEEIALPDLVPVTWESPVTRQPAVTGLTAHDSGDTGPKGVGM